MPTLQQRPEDEIKIAVLDVDGTLVPGALAAPLPAKLVDTGLCPRDRWARLRGFLVGSPADQLETSALADKANRLFAAMLTDVPCRAVSEVVAEVWLRQREQVFDFVRPLVDTLRDARFTVVLISGGPEEMVAHLAADLGIDRFRGTSFAAEEGLYTGVVEAGVNSGKEQAASELAGGAVKLAGVGGRRQHAGRRLAAGKDREPGRIRTVPCAARPRPRRWLAGSRPPRHRLRAP